MIYEQIYNPSHKTFGKCLEYILRCDTTVKVSRRSVGFYGTGGDLDAIRDLADALAPLAAEYGTPHARARTRPWRHSILSLPQHEDLTDSTMLDISVEATRKLGAKGKREPDMPMFVAVHRDTDNLHAHILSVPVDVSTRTRVRAPQSIAAYRSVIAPIEMRLGLSAPKAVGRWDGKRFHLPFKTWVKMDQDRLKDVRSALTKSKTWEECMRRLKVHGIKFKETGPNFSSSTRYYLAPFGSRRRLDAGMAIQRDVFAGFVNPPTASSIVKDWGRFPEDYQKQLEADAPAGMGYTETAIGGRRGRSLYKRWEGYAQHKRSQREILVRLFNDALKEARAKDERGLSEQERRILRDPKGRKAEVLDQAAPMKFADWTVSMADRRDPDAQWLCRLAADGTNEDPKAAVDAEREGDMSFKGDVDELEIARQTVTKMEREKLAAILQKAKEEEKAAKRRAESEKAAQRARRPLGIPVMQQSARPPPLAQRGALLESLL